MVIVALTSVLVSEVGAQAQQIVSATMSPSTYSGAGQTLTLTVTFKTGSLAWNSAVVEFQGYSPVTTNCPPGTNVTDPNQQITCTGTYVTTASDVSNGAVQLTGEVLVLDGSAHLSISGIVQSTYSPGGGPTPTTTSVSGSPNPSTHGQNVTITATVIGNSPTGTVTFTDGPTNLGSASVSGGTASITVSSLSAGNHTITATYGGDSNNNGSNDSYSQTVNSDLTATQAVASNTLTQNHAATAFTPVTGGGGTGSLSYGVSPTLPTGLSFNTSNGQITGTPSATLAATSFTVTVTDANSVTASNTFSLTVNTAVTATQAVASKTLTQNHAATAFTPVTGGGGTGSLSYSVSPSLPTGLSFNTSTGQITGTPSVTLAATSFTVTVTDQNSATASNTFSLTVNNAVTATQAVASATLTQNHAATAFTPVTGGGGTGSLSYGVSPSLPTGLSFNTSTGQITGTPTTASATTSYTVTVTDANSATASNTFSLTVNGAVTATQAVPSTTLTQNHAATAFTPVIGGGGTGSLSYGVSPSLPTGLSFNTSNGQITGTPTATSATTTYTVTVTDANSATASNTFSLTVNNAVTATQAVASATLTQNHAATAFTPVIGGGGTGALSYSVSPSLPTGLSLSSSTGQVTGTPTSASATTTYTVTVTDTNNATASNTFSLTVNGAVTATQAVASITLTANSAASPVTPVTGGGGTPPLSYSVSPTLPTGLSFNSSSGQITGTPTASSSATTYTVTVTDANSASATATFSLAVNPELTTTLAIPSTTLTANTAATPFTPVTATGGTGTLTYAVSPALPAGLSFNTSNGQITGTPTASSAAATYTVTVTDQTTPTPQTSSKTFSLAVNAAATTVNLASSPNPSQLHQTVTFTATVVGAGGTPTGTVTFKDGSTTLATVTLASGSATFATSALALGTHSITAAYSGNGAYLASTSSALQQAVAVPTDSINLRSMQIAATPQIATVYGQMVIGAIDQAISAGFSDNPPAFVSNGSGFTAYLFAGPNGETTSTAQNTDLQNFIFNPAQKGVNRRVDDGFAALAYSGSKPPTKAPPKPMEVQRDWLAWIDVRGMSLVRNSSGDDMRGNQVSALFGLTRKFSPNFIGGAFGGYDYFSYSSDALNSQLKGNGWTVGAYLGWRFATGLRFDLALARSEVSFNGASGAATATFPGHRWLLSGGVTGDYHWQGLDLAPSVKVYGLWEHEDGYTDSLTIVEPDRNFATGRASGGTKFAYPMLWGGGQFTPYVGLYGDYYFTKDDAAQATLGSVPLLQGWSARATGGLSFNLGNGASFDLGGEYGGIGSTTHIWVYRAQAHVPF